jgi:hypothetical protein
MNIAGFVALCSTVVLSAVGVGSAVNLEKTEEVNKKVAQVETVKQAPRDTYNNYGVVNNYETHNYYEEVTKEVDEEEVKEMVHDAYFEERVKEAEEKSNQLTYEELQALIYDGSKENAPTNSVNNNNNKGFKSVLKCEVCERTGTELEAWTDVNNIKHYTCKERCTGGLDVLYGE